jgi:hypothetical protein
MPPRMVNASTPKKTPALATPRMAAPSLVAFVI